MRQPLPSSTYRHDTTWVYLDGSAGALGYGSAATLFFPNGSRWVLCQTSPYQSSEGSEFWAAIMFLRWALASHPHLTLAVLGDNLHVVTVLSPNSPPGLPSHSPAGTLESSLQFIQASLRPGMIQGSGWIKGHAGFVRNEISDAYSKYDGLGPLPPSPPPIGCISRGPLSVIHKLTTHATNRKTSTCHPASTFTTTLHGSKASFSSGPPETSIWRSLLSTTTCALAIATLAPTHTQWMLSLSSHTARHENTWCRPTSDAGAPPSPQWCPNGGPRPHTSMRSAISSGGWALCPCSGSSQPPPPAEENRHTVMT